MDALGEALKKEVLEKKPEWEKKKTTVELNLWECGNIHAAIDITLRFLKDEETITSLQLLSHKFKLLRFKLENE